MLFTIAIDALNSLLLHAHRSDLLQRLTTRHASSSISLYADDVIIFCHPSTRDLRVIRELLRVFGKASGLCTNFAKCSATPIRCDDPTRASIACELACTVMDFPITYLGIPLSLRKPSASSLRPIVEKLAKKLSSWRAMLLSRGERLALVRHVLCVLPSHIMVVIVLCPTILKQVNRTIPNSSGMAIRRPALATGQSTGSASAGPSISVGSASRTSIGKGYRSVCAGCGCSAPTRLVKEICPRGNNKVIIYFLIS